MMLNGFCDAGNWGSLGSFGGWGWIGLILTLIFWVGSIVVPTLLVVWAIGRARVPAATVPYGSGQATAKEILQAQYARGEISREQYALKKQDIGTRNVSESRKGVSEP